MTLMQFVAGLAGFLCTYLVHSTLILVPVWWLTVKRRWPFDPGLRSQLLKLSLVAPLGTTLLLTSWGHLHCGLQIPLVSRSVHGSSTKPVLTNDTFSHVAALPERAHAARPIRSVATDTDQQAGMLEAANGHRGGGEFDSPSIGDASTERGSFSSASQEVNHYSLIAVALLWAAVVAVGLVQLARQWAGLRYLRSHASPVDDAGLLKETGRLQARLRVRGPVQLLESEETTVPLAAGIFRPFILLPVNTQKNDSSSAMLAHELAHIASRDALWNLVLQMVCRVFFFQPFNWMTRKAVRQQMDFSADAMAVKVLGDQMSLVHCLYDMGFHLKTQRVTDSSVALACGMALFQSPLSQRIEAILKIDPTASRPKLLTRTTLVLAAATCAIAVSLLAPRAVAEVTPFSYHFSPPGDITMKRAIASLLVLAGLNAPATADEPAVGSAASQQAEAAPLKTTPDELPEGIRRFNGMLVGRVAAKDAERGKFTVVVDAVPRVWRNSQAEDPRSVVGKTVEVSGVFGKFLDVLVVTRVGETLEFECKHDGDGLVFPGELLRKVAPYDPADYPVLPESFRGFRGRVAAEILKKDPETFELIIQVDSVLKTWDESGSKEPKSIEGRSLMLAGFWNRRDAYHDLKVGDRIDVGMQHIGLRSDHMTVAEDIRKLAKVRRVMESEGRRMERSEGGDREEQADPLQGFKGMLVGRLLEKDAERGTFTIVVDAVPRVWENNRSANPKALVGRKVTAEGVSGRLIDPLVVTRVGDTIEFGALHDEGPWIRVGEVLHKVAPVKPGDYPVLPDGFRGFRGMVTAKVIRKGDELSELIVEVEEVHETFDASRAEEPESIVGKQAILAGFWNRKDDFHKIRVGDRIRCGMNHTQLLSDHLVVIESVRKLDGDTEKR